MKDAKACTKDEFRDPRTGRCRWRWSADGRVYNVREWRKENFEESFGSKAPDWWHEYEVWLMDLKKDGRVIDEWDSQFETYIPGQELTEAKAKRSLEEVMDDINKKHIKPEHWFSHIER